LVAASSIAAAEAARGMRATGVAWTARARPVMKKVESFMLTGGDG